MNRLHRWYCRSSQWKKKLDYDILPWALNGVPLGDEVLEVGPGPGLTTDWLSHRAKSVTCIEVDRAFASALTSRTGNTNITVLRGDATAMSLPDQVFSGAVCFTVLHHLPSPALQDRLFAEMFRVLRPGGVLAGTDSMQSLLMRIFHIGDTMVLVDPASLPPRLESAGFCDVKIEIAAGRFRFFARRSI
jgi:SAM-dependent methyltransferase